MNAPEFVHLFYFFFFLCVSFLCSCFISCEESSFSLIVYLNFYINSVLKKLAFLDLRGFILADRISQFRLAEELFFLVVWMFRSSIRYTTTKLRWANEWLVNCSWEVIESLFFNRWLWRLSCTSHWIWIVGFVDLVSAPWIVSLVVTNIFFSSEVGVLIWCDNGEVFLSISRVTIQCNGGTVQIDCSFYFW